VEGQCFSWEGEKRIKVGTANAKGGFRIDKNSGMSKVAVRRRRGDPFSRGEPASRKKKHSYRRGPDRNWGRNSGKKGVAWQN